jgi:hypothetical protein
MAFSWPATSLHAVVGAGWTRRILCSAEPRQGLSFCSPPGVTVTGAASTAPAPATIGCLQLFVGSTESVTVTKVMLQKPSVTHWVGRGKISPDGSLELEQHVKEEGGREFGRRWNIRQVAPRRFAGTMSEASGPVGVDRIGDRYRFRFAMKGNLSI